MSEHSIDLAEVPLYADGPVPVHLRLTHCVATDPEIRDKPRKPVLLLHGASANRGSFMTPSVRYGAGPSLAEWLVSNFDPWLLDWRGSGHVVADDQNRAFLGDKETGHLFNYNAAAEFDIPPAVATIRHHLKWEKPIAAFGHCMGSTILAEAVAMNHVNPTEVDCVVLSALGLFYEAPIDGRLKSEERILEQLSAESVGGELCSKIDPSVERESDGRFKESASWPKALDRLYQSWPGRLKSHVEKPATVTDPNTKMSEEQLENAREMCNRVSFMYGAPYRHENLVEEIHGTDSMAPTLPVQFGAIPLHMYIHAARNIRRGRATYYRPLEEKPDKASTRNNILLSDDARNKFRAMKRVTLITGAMNRLWHRDSIDLMYEWVRRGPKSSCVLSKRVFAGYGHQDLLWGKHAARDVFPTIKNGLK